MAKIASRREIGETTFSLCLVLGFGCLLQDAERRYSGADVFDRDITIEHCGFSEAVSNLLQFEIHKIPILRLDRLP